jgi:hypothetical protein
MKLSNPFKDKAIRITQTSHNNLGGHSDFSLVRAIDCVPEPYNVNIYAEGDGVVIASVNASNPNSYLHIHYDGLPGHIIRELVHVRPSVAKGAKVKRGQLVGTLEPYRANWYGTGKNHAVHLHWSFLNTNKTGAPNPFNYLDRKTKVTTNFAVIKNSRTWFNANGTFNWSSFGDYKLDIKPVTPPAPVDPCANEKKKIATLEAQIKALEKANANFKNIEDGYLEEIKKHKEARQVITGQYTMATNEIGRLSKEIGMKNADINRLETKIENLKGELIKKDNDIKGLKEKVKGNFEDVTFREIITMIGVWFTKGKRQAEEGE